MTTVVDTVTGTIEAALTGMRRIALVGASPDPARPSHGVHRRLLDAGYEVVPVTPTHDEVLGARAWPDLAAVPGRVDAVDVFRPAAELPGIARAAVDRGDVAVVWAQLGLVSDEARRIADGAGLLHVEDRCLGVEVERHGAAPPAGPRLEHPVLLVDLDGTVFDYATAERRALTATLERLEVPVDEPTVATYRRINAAHWAAFERDELTSTELRSARWAAFVDELGLAADGETASRHYLGELGAAGDLLAGARAALWWLGRRATLVAVTNGFDDIQRGRMDAADLWGAFDGFVTSDGVGASKPDPAIVEAALATVDATDADPADLAIIGDSLSSDIAAGEAVGCHTVWIAPGDAVIPTGGPQPDVHVARLADVA